MSDIFTHREVCGHLESCEYCHGTNLSVAGVYFFTEPIDETTSEEFRMEIYRMALDRSPTLVRADQAKNLTLFLESPGGSVLDGMAMYNTLLSAKKLCGWDITIHVQGMAASMATVLLQAADKRIMSQGAQLLLHNIRSSMWGEKLEDMKQLIRAQDTSFHTICGIYAARNTAGYNDVEWWKTKIRYDEWYLTADEALKFGLIDEIE